MNIQVGKNNNQRKSINLREDMGGTGGRKEGE